MKLALATAIAALSLDEDLAPLHQACIDAGIDAQVLAWDDPTVSWSRFDAVLLRSTWDYMDRLPEFLAWCDRVHAVSRLWNPPEVVRWNTDKRYLADLAARGLPVIESHFLAPGDDPASLPDLDEFVVKPTVGAGSRDAQRYQRGDRDAAVAHVRRLLDAGRHVLVQPYLHAVDEHGETALLFFDGRFSHAIRKAPLLRRGEGPTRALFKEEHIQPREPSDAEHALAAAVLASLPFETLAYARVDLLPSPSGPQLLELELTEPSVFLPYGEGSGARFARVLARRLEMA
ncbi:RimK family alpha-L-glutamate ligase [Arenimonas sp.]|uniref:ATP-grasp domain-containing protein n=1 Tax=Arenimonas sp. TaxID=1872635 RepID=UPI0035AD808E